MLAVIGAGQPWATLSVEVDLPGIGTGPVGAAELTGNDLGPYGALALLGLVLLVAVAATRGRGRWVVGVALLALGVALVAGGLLGGWRAPGGRERAWSGHLAGVSTGTELQVARSPAGPALVVAGGLLLAGAGAEALPRGRGWPPLATPSGPRPTAPSPPPGGRAAVGGDWDLHLARTRWWSPPEPVPAMLASARRRRGLVDARAPLQGDRAAGRGRGVHRRPGPAVPGARRLPGRVRTDGPSGLAAVDAERPRLVLLDLMLAWTGSRSPGPAPARRPGADHRGHGPRGGGRPRPRPRARRRRLRHQAVLPRELVAPGSRPSSAAPSPARGRPRAALHLGSLTVDPARHEVVFEGRPVQLTAREFELLSYLVRNRGLVLTRDQILERVWGYSFPADTRTVDVHIRQLRSKLGDHAPIVTIRGVGYKADGQEPAGRIC